MWNKKLLYINFVILQLAIIGTLASVIYYNSHNKVLGVSTYTLDKKSITVTTGNGLKYFYTLTPSKDLVDYLPLQSQTFFHKINASGFNQVADYPI